MTITRISEEEFDILLRSFRRTAFHLECRDWYALDYERVDFERFLAGSPAPPPELDWWRPWLEQIARLRREGKIVGRVRVLAEPPSDYQQWMIWAAPWHALAGEQISYIPRSRAQEIHLPDRGPDWWLLDDEQVIVTQFTSAGEIAEKRLLTGRELVSRYITWRDLAVRNATPAEEYAAA